jgi:hypothetical protein
MTPRGKPLGRPGFCLSTSACVLTNYPQFHEMTIYREKVTLAVLYITLAQLVFSLVREKALSHRDDRPLVG